MVLCASNCFCDTVLRMDSKSDFKVGIDYGNGVDLLASKKAAKDLVEIVGTGLGNLVWRIYNGNFKIDKYSEKEIKRNYKGTKYFVLGGSIGTNGYTKTLLPILAQKQISKLSGGGTDMPEIFSTNLDSATAGSLGAFHAFDKDTINKISNEAREIYKNNKIPLIPLIDIGGTKIHLVIAYLDQDGRPNNKIIQNHRFPTRRCDTPEEFYQQLISYIRPVLDNFKGGVYQILPRLAIAQPGGFTDPRGVINGGANDLGTSDGLFHGSNPSHDV